jgi:hypothetical protein
MRSPFSLEPTYAGRMTAPEDIMFCTECGEMCEMYMPDEELMYGGPISVCRNNYCGYFVRSLDWTREHMGVSWMYRNCYVHSDKQWMPITFTMTDNPNAFWAMGPPWQAIKDWNASLDWSEAAKGNDPSCWEAMYDNIKVI